MRVVAVLAALCVVMMVGAAGVQASDACGGNDYGQSGVFDFYVFEQSWPAQFCQAHMDWPGCSNPTAWQAHNLTMHGMWPNYNQAQGSHDWPQCCDSKYGNDIDPNVAQSLLPSFQTYWPNEQDPSGGDLSSSLWRTSGRSTAPAPVWTSAPTSRRPCRLSSLWALPLPSPTTSVAPSSSTS